MLFPPYFGCVLLGVDSLQGGLAEGNRILGRRFESWSVNAGGGTAAIFAAAGFELPTKKFAVACITIRPLPILRPSSSPHCLNPCLPVTKTQSVCFCLTDCWPV